MPSFLLHHSHDAHECAAAFAAWQGFDSPLRHRRAPSTCLAGGHALWWRVEASDRRAALELLPGSWPSGPRPSRSERCRSHERADPRLTLSTIIVFNVSRVAGARRSG